MTDRSGSNKRQRTVQVGLRFTPEEAAELWDKATDLELNIQSYIRKELGLDYGEEKAQKEGQAPSSLP